MTTKKPNEKEKREGSLLLENSTKISKNLQENTYDKSKQQEKRKKEINTIILKLHKYWVANPDIKFGKLLTEINSGRHVVQFLDDKVLQHKLDVRLNKLKKEV